MRTQSYENVKALFKGIDNQTSVGLEKNIELSRKIALAGQTNSPKAARASDRISPPPGLISDEHARFVALKGEREELKHQKGIISAGEHWTQLSPEIKKVLHDAQAAGSWLATLRHTTRLGLMHMGQPPNFIPQVVQLAASACSCSSSPGAPSCFWCKGLSGWRVHPIPNRASPPQFWIRCATSPVC